ncbi:MAG: YegP family protein [Alphaproteobacteria bacterium]|nr:YegP family protein [Alphaproteobacteria bacterium]
MSGKYVIKSNESGKITFNLKAGNGQIILTSETYESRAAAVNGIASVRKNATDDSRYERKISKAGEPFFVLKAGNGEIIGKSEMYSAAAAMENGIASVKQNAPEAPLEEDSAAA